MTEPTTEAGRRLLQAIFAEEGGMPVDPGAAILAIEDEALATVPPALDVERLALVVDELRDRGYSMAEASTIASTYARLAREASDGA